MEITTELQEVLKKHLPQMQADEFKKFIEEANANKEELAKAKNRISIDSRELETLKYNKSTYEGANKLKQEAEAKLKLAEEKEHKIDLTIKDEQIKQRDYVISSFYQFLSLLTTNPRAIELISENRWGNVPVKDQYGNFSTQPSNENVSGQIEHKEVKP